MRNNESTSEVRLSSNSDNSSQIKLSKSNFFNSSDFVITNQKGLKNIGSKSNITIEDIENANSFLSKFNVQGRKTYAKNTIDLDIQNSDKLNMNNSSITIFYEVSDNLQFGLEFSREGFAQRFELTEGNLTTNYQQFFNTNIFGIAGKYYIPIKLINDRLTFFSKGFVGGTNLGPVTRLELGSELRLIQNWSLFAGYEISNLTYFFEGNTFNSTRTGFLTGLRYDF